MIKIAFVVWPGPAADFVLRTIPFVRLQAPVLQFAFVKAHGRMVIGVNVHFAPFPKSFNESGPCC